MYEFVFVVWILVNGAVSGSVTIQTKTPEMCETLHQAMVEDSIRIPQASSVQTLVMECAKRRDT